MGSTGSGRFTDYSESQSSGEGSSAEGGGSGGVDRCTQAFNCTLEEVSQCDFFTNNGNTPAIRTTLNLVLTNRLFAATSTGEIVGALPTRFNYLAGCLEEGYSYIGIITASSTSPVPTVSADFSVQ